MASERIPTTTHLLGGQIDPGLDVMVDASCVLAEIETARQRCRECYAQVERRVECWQEIRDDVHLVDAFHLQICLG
jgi:hypothetical protein